MKKAIALLIVIPPLLFGLLFVFELYEGPRMTVQHHVREFQMVMPARVPGTVAVAPATRLPSPTEAASLKNPLPSTSENVARGAVYYQYYCVFCHGDSGAGNGPVGDSYTPRPADLRTGRAATLRDAELLRAMLTGTGHEPVLERVVPPEHRWFLVLYLRSLPRSR